MIPAIFDRGWVHPWKRPAEDKRAVRLSAEPARVAPPPKPEWERLAEEIIDTAEPVRVVSPLPPHEPEPFPAEPFAPVYNYRVPPLLAAGELDQAPSPRHPDPLVFGEPGVSQGKSQQGDGEYRYCRVCDVKWRGDPECWACGRRT